MEPSYFSAFFRRKTGMPPAHWLGIVRTNAAKRLLEQQNFTVEELSDVLSFGSVRTFQRTFKRHAGCTPTAYRAGIRDGHGCDPGESDSDRH